MDIYVYSVFVLSCVGKWPCDGLIPVQGILPTVYKIHNFIMNSEWEQARGPNPSLWEEDGEEVVEWGDNQ
jgi:hypothetical protein